MITRRTMRWDYMARRLWKQFLIMIAYTVGVVYLERSDVPLDVPVAIPALLGTAISILLGFRTNSAYDRWWEARKIWGAIVNDSRTFARQVLTLIQGHEEGPALQKEMVYRHIGWLHVLRRWLRNQDPFEDLQGLLPQQEIDALRGQQTPQNAILQTQTERLVEAQQRGYIDPILMLPVERTLKHFSDHMGMAERIKKTVFPTQYGYLVSRIIWLFFLMLPAGLSPHLGWIAVPVSLMVSAVFVLIESMGSYLQSPFENKRTDTPMTAICRTIEIDLRQQLGETDLPAKLEPVDGVLM